MLSVNVFYYEEVNKAEHHKCSNGKEPSLTLSYGFRDVHSIVTNLTYSELRLLGDIENNTEHYGQKYQVNLEIDGMK